MPFKIIWLFYIYLSLSTFIFKINKSALDVEISM